MRPLIPALPKARSYRIMAALAEFEVDMIRENVRAGLLYAKAREGELDALDCRTQRRQAVQRYGYGSRRSGKGAVCTRLTIQIGKGIDPVREQLGS
jgi:DNA invertase Pin-like site-specific DNA recombinase